MTSKWLTVRHKNACSRDLHFSWGSFPPTSYSCGTQRHPSLSRLPNPRPRAGSDDNLTETLQPSSVAELAAVCAPAPGPHAPPLKFASLFWMTLITPSPGAPYQDSLALTHNAGLPLQGPPWVEALELGLSLWLSHCPAYPSTLHRGCPFPSRTCLHITEPSLWLGPVLSSCVAQHVPPNSWTLLSGFSSHWWLGSGAAERSWEVWLGQYRSTAYRLGWPSSSHRVERREDSYYSCYEGSFPSNFAGPNPDSSPWAPLPVPRSHRVCTTLVGVWWREEVEQSRPRYQEDLGAKHVTSLTDGVSIITSPCWGNWGTEQGKDLLRATWGHLEPEFPTKP